MKSICIISLLAVLSSNVQAQNTETAKKKDSTLSQLEAAKKYGEDVKFKNSAF